MRRAARALSASAVRAERMGHAAARRAVASQAGAPPSRGGASADGVPPPPPPPSAAAAAAAEKSSSAAYDAEGKPLPSIPDATTVFRLSNPELMLDPRKSASWAVVFGVIAFFGTYLGWTAWREGLLGDGGAKLAAEYAAECERDLEVRQVLPDGRLLMRDGSIRRPPAAGAVPDGSRGR